MTETTATATPIAAEESKTDLLPADFNPRKHVEKKGLSGCVANIVNSNELPR